MGKLSTFCDERGMNVDLDQTKTLVYSASTRKKRYITFQGKEIEIAKSYIYLGITFNHLGCSTEAKHNLYLKVLKQCHQTTWCVT